MLLDCESRPGNSSCTLKNAKRMQKLNAWINLNAMSFDEN